MSPYKKGVLHNCGRKCPLENGFCSLKNIPISKHLINGISFLLSWVKYRYITYHFKKKKNVSELEQYFQTGTKSNIWPSIRRWWWFCFVLFLERRVGWWVVVLQGLEGFSKATTPSTLPVPFLGYPLISLLGL